MATQRVDHLLTFTSIQRPNRVNASFSRALPTTPHNKQAKESN